MSALPVCNLQRTRLSIHQVQLQAKVRYMNRFWVPSVVTRTPDGKGFKIEPNEAFPKGGYAKPEEVVLL